MADERTHGTSARNRRACASRRSGRHGRDTAAVPDLPEIAVIGGSGFYSFVEDMREVDVETLYGPPSGPVALGELAGRPVALLARHGRRHEHPPHRINYRANLWALRSVGARRVLAPCAVGSLRPEVGTGTLVVPDQLVDHTRGRAQTFFEVGAVHVGFADPYCPQVRETVLRVARDRGQQVVGGGTMVVVDSPRFSTRAESTWFAAAGWSLVNMTGYPEAVLARELAMCYAAVALVTDLDAGVDAAGAVNQAEVFRTFARDLDRLRELLRLVVVALPAKRTCECPRVHDGIELPFPLP